LKELEKLKRLIEISISNSGNRNLMRSDLQQRGNWLCKHLSSKAEMLVNSDFKELLSILNGKGVKYLVIGGYAFIKYAEPRYTKDLDLWVLADSQNADAIFSALRAFGAPLTNLTPDDFAKEGYFYQMGVPPVRVDILMSIPGLSFDEAWKKREEVNFDGVQLPFISKQDLIISKRASGRPQDILDAEALEQSPD
jgi:predicted nucleotidyltransferase